MKKKIAFVHYRTGERDGVSLEIDKRAAAAEKIGAEAYFITGFDGLNRKNAIVIPELDLKTSTNKLLLETFFDEKKLEDKDALFAYFNLETQMYQKLLAAFESIKPDLVMVHNMLSLSYNLPATTALIKVLDKLQIDTIPVHHDFWFEREKFLQPKYEFIKEIQDRLPPNRPYIIKHIAINSLALHELEKRRKIKAQQIGDYFDFSQPQVKVDDYNSDLLKAFDIDENDIFVLQATRITNRKAIENAMYFVYHLEKLLRQKSPIHIHNKIFTEKNRAVLFLPNFVEVDAIEYFQELQELAKDLQIKVIWGQEKFANERKVINGNKIYSFWDVYAFADLVTYPSILEGFGNQFLEATFFKKLPVLFEYPVFLRDIKKEGYQYVSFGDTFEKKNGLHFFPESKIIAAAQETITVLQDTQKLQAITERNFEIARQHHDESYLVSDLQNILKSDIN